MDFKKFRNAVAAQFKVMEKHELFRTTATKDTLWDTYLGSFPEGSNLKYRERTEHDCNSCKQFIRAVGNVVAIINGQVVSIWDCTAGDPAYQKVTDAMAAYVKSCAIDGPFVHTERVAGTEKNFEQIASGAKQWDHFFVNVPAAYVMKGVDIGTYLSNARANRDVLFRSIREITAEAVDTVLELIAANSLYRGDEHKFAVSEFKKLQVEATKMQTSTAAINDKRLDIFCWSKIKATPGSVAKIRNSAIGTLLTDLSTGLEIDAAVRRFEQVVAPANYKRPTALVTSGMIAKAKEKIQELNLTSALERRYAELADITVNNILFANRDAKKALTGDVFSDLASAVTIKDTKKFDSVQEIGIEKFISDILPTAKSIEIMFENKHAGNFVSLIAPEHATAEQMFKWNNRFSWSYVGDMADSIKERVKAAGGNVTGDACIRLAWFNHDDLDLSVTEPNRNRVYFGNRHAPSSYGGQLDVDMNLGSNLSMTPVENIVYKDKNRMGEGNYEVAVHNYNKRHSTNVGFEVEIDLLGKVYKITHANALPSGQRVVVATFNYSRKNGFTMNDSIPFKEISKDVWGISSQAFHKVNVMMMSPNFWDDGKVGNKHYFFMIDGCKNDGTARGFFNEFLKPELDPHRKVLEMVGSKMKTAESENQLSGLGFSSTKQDSVIVKVTGAMTRTLKIVF